MKFAYPPCLPSIWTESSYRNHDWKIVNNILISKKYKDETIYYYKVICDRCKINHPEGILH